MSHILSLNFRKGHHVPEFPVMLADAARNGKIKSCVGVVIGLIDTMHQGRAIVRSHGTFTVAHHAVLKKKVAPLSQCCF